MKNLILAVLLVCSTNIFAIEAKNFSGIGIVFKENMKGLSIVDIYPDGPAANAGILKGDVIKKINGEVVKSSAQTKSNILASEESLSISISRGNTDTTFTIFKKTFAIGSANEFLSNWNDELR